MKKIMFVFFIIFISMSSFSQVNRQMGRTPQQNPPRDPQKTKVDFVEQSLDFFRKEIIVDGFQEAVIKNLLIDYEKSQREIIENESMKIIEKKQLIENSTEKFKHKLSEILTPEQFEKYNQLMEPKKKKKK